jgi:DNA-directed RNA polymerase subunit RPC12/RpoP
MFRTLWNSTSARFDLGGKQMGKMEYLLGGALTLIILGSLAISLYSFFRGGPNTSQVKPVITYHCDKCGHEFDFQAPEPDPNNPNAMMPDPMMGPRPIECPQCHAKPFSAWLMNRCVDPKCGKLFAQLPESHDPRWSGEVVCPWCKTNQTQFIRDKILKR